MRDIDSTHGQVGAGRVAIALGKLGSLQVEFNPLRSSGGDRLIPDAQRRKWAQKHACAHGASEWWLGVLAEISVPPRPVLAEALHILPGSDSILWAGGFH